MGYDLADMSEADENQLIADHFLFQKPDPNAMIYGCGGCRDWPDARGIYHNDEKTFLVWVNEEDQMRLSPCRRVATSSRSSHAGSTASMRSKKLLRPRDSSSWPTTTWECSPLACPTWALACARPCTCCSRSCTSKSACTPWRSWPIRWRCRCAAPAANTALRAQGAKWISATACALAGARCSLCKRWSTVCRSSLVLRRDAKLAKTLKRRLRH